MSNTDRLSSSSNCYVSYVDGFGDSYCSGQ